MEDLKEALEKLKEALRKPSVPAIEPLEEKSVEKSRYRYYKRAVALINKSLMQLRAFKRALYEEPEIRSVERRYVLVMIEKNVSGFLGIDGKFYGPYKREDIVLLPKETAEILIREGIARLIE